MGGTYEYVSTKRQASKDKRIPIQKRKWFKRKAGKVMSEQPGKRYDLEDRTFKFAKRCRAFVRSVPRTVTTLDDVRQLVRSSGSVAANYIEANEALSKKDFRMRIKIARKEAKESALWLRLLGTAPKVDAAEQTALHSEAVELTRIFSAILRKTETPAPDQV
jgi:four helix bundle protein